ncbi:SDR family oxidoreductase [Clostridium thermarum]|uniref:SDR family oxidoreductase n=1 Tax=Clostridium thermarum TaxID=1716543 RepID=UPI00111DA7D9|nr:SDR family oxidoreductase [Clostridium thermarum]
MTEYFPGVNYPKSFPTQKQDRQPGIEKNMNPRPIFEDPDYGIAPGRLKDKIAVITGGDSGIGRAVALAFAKEGADIAIIYLNENEDAEQTKTHIDKTGRKCMLIAGDVGDENFCIEAVNRVIGEFGKIDILVNNAAEQHVQTKLEDITKEQLERTFKTNVFSAFYLTKAVLPYLKAGSSIINTTSITAYKGSQDLIDYSATKGALTTFTRSLSTNLASKNIRVNAVAPGPIWTPLIPASFNEQDVAKFGSDTPMARAGQPVELAAAYVFLASNDASYITGQTIHVNGGVIVNS